MKRKKIKFNVLDVIIVIALLALVAGILWRKELSDAVDQLDKENTVAVTCEFTNVTEEDERHMLNNLKGNPDVYYNGVKVGTIAKVTVADTEESRDEDTSLEGEKPNLLAKNVLVLAAVAKDSGYYIEDTKLVIGEEYRFSAAGWEFSVVIDSIEER